MLAWAGGVVVVVAVLGGAYLLGLRPPATAPAPGAGPTPGSPDLPVTVAASADPRQSAMAWLRGERSLSYLDPAPWTWTARVAPVVTGSLASEYLADRGAGGGAEWTDFLAQRCVTTVTNPAAVIPPEAPRSDSEVYVQVSGQAVTRCAVGEAPGGGVEQVSATVELVRGTKGYWRASRRLY